MPWWLSIVFYGLRAVGWVIGIPGMIARWQAKRQGEAQQRAADAEAALSTVKAEERAEANAPDSLAELRARLRDGGA